MKNDVSEQAYKVRVTFDKERGASGFNPFASASNAAKSCPGIMYGIGARNSSICLGIEIAREAIAAMLSSAVIAKVSACNSTNRPNKSFTPGNIAPGGAKIITGK